MRKRCFFLLLGLYFCAPAMSQTQAVTSSDLIEKAAAYDNQEISYEGEAIGTTLDRGSNVWLNVNDGNNAIGIWAGKEKTKALEHWGSYKQKGDRIFVEGVFHKACPEHGGGLDIHARQLVVVEEGGVVPETISSQKIFWLSALLGVLACLLILHIFVQRRSSK